MTCKFTINQLHADFMIKECKRCYKVGKLKVGQKLGDVLQIGATFVTRWGYYNKSSAV